MADSHHIQHETSVTDSTPQTFTGSRQLPQTATADSRHIQHETAVTDGKQQTFTGNRQSSQTTTADNVLKLNR